MDKTKRICLWSGPRNISTALMYSFAQRNDTKVVDEPLYAHYLKNTPADSYHPMAKEVLNSMEQDGKKVIKEMLFDTSKPILFSKQMTHHLVGLDLSFLKNTINIILTRDPVEMLPSFAKEIEHPVMSDVGYAQHIDLLYYLNSIGQKPIILDSKQVLLNPEKALKKLCDSIHIPFDTNMLKWEKGARKEDGIWAKHWYENVHNSNGFIPYKTKQEAFPEHLKSLLDECIPHYEKLKSLSI